MPDRWEYKLFHFQVRWPATELTSINKQFDAFGAEGWELVGTEDDELMPAGNGIIAFFKRRVSGDAESCA